MRTLRQVLTRTVLAISLIAVFGACASLPLPDLQNDGLLVIPVRHINDTDHEYFGHYRLIVETGSRRFVRKLTADVEMVALPLPAGQTYELQTSYWYEGDASPGSVHRIQSSVVRSGMITINGTYLEVRMDEPSQRNYTMSRAWRPTTESVRADTVRYLSRYQNYDRWQ